MPCRPRSREDLRHLLDVMQLVRHQLKPDLKLLGTLLSTFTVFPLLTCVRLNSKAVGRVIRTHPAKPLRPKIRLLVDPLGRRVISDRIVDLSEEPLLYIEDSVPEPGSGDDPDGDSKLAEAG